MPWSNFKSIMLSSMQSYAYGNNIDGFAKNFTLAYDTAIKSGRETLNPIPVLKGNTVGMETQLKLLMKQIQHSNSKTLLEVIGPAIITYWSGATMALIPPIIPAPGALSNIAMTQGVVLNAGKWNGIKIPPNNNSAIFLDSFINSAKLHLTTVSGIYVVIAQYPPPAPPAPGVLNWSGYIVP